MNNCPNNCKNCSEDCESRIKPLSKLQTWGILLLIAITGSFFLLISNPQKNAKTSPSFSYTYPCMGTIANISFFEEAATAEQAAKAVYNELYKMENMCSIFNPASELSKLNANAANKPFVCSKELYSLLLKCREAYELTDGAFDITAKPLMTLWGFYRRRNNIPTQKEIEKTLRLVGLNKVKFNDAERSVAFSIDGITFDLGGVAKGAALDAAVAAAKKAGAKNGIINLGGNIAVFGKNKNGKDLFEVGIRDPQKRNAVIRKLQLANAFCATSGNYERFNILAGKRYSHIMNPLTGYPVQNTYSATVVTQTGIDSDICSTACFILGVDWAKKMIDAKKINQVFLIFPAENNSITYSYQVNNITNEEKK